MGVCVCFGTLLKRKKAREKLEAYISDYRSLDLSGIISVYNYLYPENEEGNVVTLCSLKRYVKCDVCVLLF